MNRLQDQYNKEIVPALLKKMNYKSTMQVPRLEKIVISVSTSDAVQNPKIMNIIGRLTRDAEVRNLPNQKQVVNFSVAINENYRNKQGEWIEQTTFFDCAYWSLQRYRSD